MTGYLAARLNARPVSTVSRIRVATVRLALVHRRRKHRTILARQPNGPLNDSVAVLV
jgi:hypothetical protein